MKNLQNLVFGFLLGTLLIKSEAISWFRIQEMFRFQSFHMYGILGSAVLVGAITVFLIKKFHLKSFQGEDIVLGTKDFNKVGNILGGTIYGLGWAITGCCVAPIFALAGYGYAAAFVILLSVLAGAFVYGVLRDRLPH